MPSMMIFLMAATSFLLAASYSTKSGRMPAWVWVCACARTKTLKGQSSRECHLGVTFKELSTDLRDGHLGVGRATRVDRKAFQTMGRVFAHRDGDQRWPSMHNQMEVNGSTQRRKRKWKCCAELCVAGGDNTLQTNSKTKPEVRGKLKAINYIPEGGGWRLN